MGGDSSKKRSSKTATGPRLPKNAKIEKRPLVHPPVASIRAGARTPKVVYTSASSPFMSVVKRVQKYLQEADKRAMGDLKSLKLDEIAKKGRDGPQEEVLVKATGKAIEKGLHVALFFQGRDDCIVRLRTGNVATVDDIILAKKGGASLDEGSVEENLEDFPETRLRRVPMLEVAISLQ